MTILLLVSAQIPAFDPDLETTPGCTDVGVDAPSVVRIIGKPDFEGEHSSVAGESLPSNSHVTDSIPVSSQVPSLQTTFAQPTPAQAFRNFHPTDRIAVPSVVAVLLCAVRSTLVYGVAFVADQFAFLK